MDCTCRVIPGTFKSGLGVVPIRLPDADCGVHGDSPLALMKRCQNDLLREAWEKAAAPVRAAVAKAMKERSK